MVSPNPPATNEEELPRVQQSMRFRAQRLLNRSRAESTLRDLRDHNRLAMHVCEDHTPYAFPEFSWNTLSAVPSGEIAEHLRGQDMPLLSMSLLPSGASHKSILPYGVGLLQPGDYSYLVDLSQKEEDSARVLCASTSNLDTGSDPKRKKIWGLHNDRATFNPELKAIYERVGTPEEWLGQILGADGHKLGEEQLDTLGKLYLREYVPAHAGPVVSRVLMASEDMANHNEVLVASSTKHIKAIAIPYFLRKEADEAWYEPLEKLTAAMAGLQHLQKGLDVPVVLYQVSPPFPDHDHQTKQGDFAYLAKGRSELLQLAFKALVQMEENHSFEELNHSRRSYIAEALKYEVFNELGIDVSKPLLEQTDKMRALRVQANVGAASGAGRGVGV